MYLHRDAKVAYLAHPRTASQATGEALIEQLGFELIGHHHGQLDPEYDVDYSFTTIRNTFDAVVSLWHHFGRAQPMGEAFITHCFTMKPHYFPATCEWFGLHSRTATGIVRFEKLAVDLNHHLRRAGLGPVELPLKNVGWRRDGVAYQRFWDKQSKGWFEKRFAEELKRLGYEWEKLEC